MSDRIALSSLKTARIATVLAVGALSLVACGGDDPAQSEAGVASTTPAQDVAVALETIPGSTTTTTETPPPTTEAADPAPSDGPAGEPLDFGPAPGTLLHVVGVAWDDELNFRVSPDPASDIVLSAAPRRPLDLAAAGESWNAPGGVWWRVTVAGEDAWANQRYLGALGAPVAAFDQIAAELETLEYPTLDEVADAVAATRASAEPESRVVLVNEPLMFDAGGVLFVDVMDLGDDSVKGERIRIDLAPVWQAEEDAADAGEPELVAVRVTEIELTPICGRGVTTDGYCL